MYRITNNKLIKFNKLIESIWILDKKSGICLFEENLSISESNVDISADLASAFISAISTFVDETFSDGIQNIEFQKRKLFFRFTDKLLFVFIFSKSVKITIREQNKIMKEIMNDFYSRFGDKLEQGDFMNQVSDYKIFSENLKEIVRTKSPFENITNFLSFLKGDLVKIN